MRQFKPKRDTAPSAQPDSPSSSSWSWWPSSAPWPPSGFPRSAGTSATSGSRERRSPVAMEINVARSKAITKNVNLGVVFAVVNDTQYRWVVEDDQPPQTTPNWSTIQQRRLDGTDRLTATQVGVLADRCRRTSRSTRPPIAPAWAPGPTPGASASRSSARTCTFGSGSCGAAPPNATA